MPEPRGWHSRGYLPHFEGGQVVQSITFRLHGTLPGDLLDRWRRDAQRLDERQRAGFVAERVERWLGQGHGEPLLAQPGVAALVEQALLWADGSRYALYAWVVMPNHVHVLMSPRAGHEVSRLVQSWKGYSARRINELLGRSGALWQPDYYDRYIRDGRHFDAELAYIEANPVKAGLCETSDGWRFGSAWWRAGAPSLGPADAGLADLEVRAPSEEEARW